jgi:transcriptional regulator with XRE-family HTH domain
MRKSIHSAPYVLLRERLKAARVAAGLTQVELSAKLERPQSYVAKYEGGDRRLDVVELIEVCKLLNVSAYDIIAGIQHSENINL